ncbi:MAG: ABC transporter permease subunit [Planctomycetes bacterium]|nr:ABC transporter permease subunit [Planctomycetota bacterium]
MAIDLKKSVSNKKTIRIAKLWDALAKYIITFGGIAVIVSVVLILLLIVSVTLPLFESSTATPVEATKLADSVVKARPMGIGVSMSADGNFVTSYVLTADGEISVINMRDLRVIGESKVKCPGSHEDARILHATPYGQDQFSLLWDNGAASMIEVKLADKYDSAGNRYIAHDVYTRAGIEKVTGGSPVKSIIRKSEEGTVTCAVLLHNNKIFIKRIVREEDLLGDIIEKEVSFLLEKDIPGQVTSITMDEQGSFLFAGTDNGAIVRWAFEDDQESAPDAEVTTAFIDKRRITSLVMIFGDVSLAVGDEKGEVSTWLRVRSGDSGARKLRKIHSLKSHPDPVVDLIPSRRNKLLISLDRGGSAYIDYMTSERHLITVTNDRPLAMVSFSPRGNAMLGLDEKNNLIAWKLHMEHPEVSWKTLFAPVHYEGYDEPDYVWQTTGGEDFEAKFSLTPLLFGTFKGTLYAMLFSVPLALFGAVYTSQFTSYEFRRVIKPAVEIMAAVPSVVIGFLVALWLAPIMERWIITFFSALITIPGIFIIFMLCWQRLRHANWAKRIERGYEFMALVPVVLIGVFVAYEVTPLLENMLFDGNFKQWLFDGKSSCWLTNWWSGGMRYDQRNSIIISFGLGFAVIPIIFSIAEDSLTNVPQALNAASLALGASRWQTVWRVVLPSAIPGIFAAIMIGFGRAIGETMIVLMATGNTPIIDLSPFNGMRTLSANIAVEIPEAPVGGTLYRTLFLCAVLLFVLTFFLNTLAEVVRENLRKKYGRF